MFVKVCGITNEEDALLATALGADALGFIFAPSKRQVRPDDVRDILRRLPREIVTVGVFRNESPERIVDIVSRTGLHGAQLHGHEPPSEVEWVHGRVQFVIQAFTAGAPELADAAHSPAEIILVDSPDPGSGKVFDWQLAEGAPAGIRLMVAGGLTPENVAEAIARLRPWGVDVASGVEERPGRKDPQKLRAFIEAARGAGRDVSGPDGDDPDAVAGVTRPWDWQLDS